MTEEVEFTYHGRTFNVCFYFEWEHGRYDARIYERVGDALEDTFYRESYLGHQYDTMVQKTFLHLMTMVNEEEQPDE